MKVDELVKLAETNKEVKDALKVFAGAIEKRAAGEDTQFNETVPVQEEGGGEAPADAQTPVGPEGAMAAAPPQAAPLPPEQMGPPPEEGLNPSTEAATAAQTFLAPVFEAASQGDPNAQNVIAKAAGEIAKGVASAAVETMAMGGGMAPPAPAEGMPAEAMPPEAAMAPPPEEQMADQIVPEQAAPATAPAEAPVEGAPPAQGPNGEAVAPAKAAPPKKKDKEYTGEKKKEEESEKVSMDLETVGKIIKLVKDGAL